VLPSPQMWKFPVRSKPEVASPFELSEAVA
jgi:hypothetical protein